jgi:hypothetical protein
MRSFEWGRGIELSNLQQKDEDESTAFRHTEGRNIAVTK